MIIGDRYELDDFPLGRGGMGEVYGGYDKKLDRRVAVKLVRFPYGRPDEALVKRFIHEARVMAKLEHPGTPAIYDADVHHDPHSDPRPFMVMQFVDGVTLDHLLGEQGRLPIGWAVAVAAQTVAVLHAAHERGIFHRDLKPSNLMLCSEGTVKVLDFGLAMFHDPELSKLTRTGTVLGTPAYMSPEQIRGAALGPQSDLYSLGLVLHELLTGLRMFDGRTEYDIFDRQVNEPASPVRLQRPEVPEDLDRLVLSLLEKRAENRPAQAKEVHDCLLPFATDLHAIPGIVSPAPSPLRMYADVISRVVPRPPTFTAPSAIPVTIGLSTSDTDGEWQLSQGDIARARSEARALAKESRYGQAVEVLDAVVARAGRALGPMEDEVLALRLHLAEVLFEGSDYRRAASAFAELNHDLTKKHGPQDDAVLHCRRQEATCQALMGQMGTALSMLEGLLSDERDLYGEDDPRTLDLRRQIGLLQLSAGDTEQARHILSGLLEDLTRLYGQKHPDAVRVRDSLSRLSM
ncbi:serine/threonine protein kinase PkaE [Sphaerisporangium flaviroseum]|uniref:non-specific serine/threonine protein kinase n=1 Tax=Sphaerisporangium flaviroseum TaxID=509199 RepID=A0ABP7IA37_9ACTN